MRDTLDTAYKNRFPRSAELYSQAANIFPSGVTHDGRFLTPFPVYVESAQGAIKKSVDGPELVDFWSGHGALLLGHGHPAIVAAVQRQMERGTHYGACHELEIEWARRIQQLMPVAERVRFTSSGTEATLMALRVARIATGRSKVVKLAGHFHGWHDQLAPAADPPHENGIYPTPGVIDDVLGQLVIVPPNNIDAVARAIKEHQPACVIVEGTGGRWGVVPLNSDFMKELRELTRRTGTLMIADEVITGFRVAPGGAQQHFGITPDLTTLAKIVAGGLPGGALVGRADYMEALAFENRYGQKMKHPGTFNGNPLSAAAGIAMLDEVATGEPCRKASAAGAALRRGLNSLFERQGINWLAYGHFSLTHLLPNYDGPRPTGDDFIPYNGDLQRIDQPIPRELSHAFRRAAVLYGNDCMGVGMITNAAHDEAVIERALVGFEKAFDWLRKERVIA